MSSREKEPVKISTVLDSVLDAYGLTEAVEQTDYVKQWRGVVGPTIAERTRVHRFYRGILTVRVANSTWLQELNFHKEIILKRLRDEITDSSITDIRFILGNVR